MYYVVEFSTFFYLSHFQYGSNIIVEVKKTKIKKNYLVYMYVYIFMCVYILYMG